VRVVKGFGTEPAPDRPARARSRPGPARGPRRGAAAGQLPARRGLLAAFALVVILGYGGHLVLTGKLQIGDLVAFNTYILFLLFPLRMPGCRSPRPPAPRRRGPNRRAARHRLARRRPAAPHDAAHRRHGAVQFEGVRFAYGSGTPVLDGLDLVIPAGEAVALVGATATARPRWRDSCPRFYDVDAGRRAPRRGDIRQLKLRDLRRAIGIVFEDTFSFTDTVAENIAFADPTSMDSVRNAAAFAGATSSSSPPRGYAP